MTKGFKYEKPTLFSLDPKSDEIGIGHCYGGSGDAACQDGYSAGPTGYSCGNGMSAKAGCGHGNTPTLNCATGTAPPNYCSGGSVL